MPGAADVPRRGLKRQASRVDNDVVEPISPELVMVDPELARIARELLPQPRDCLAPHPPSSRPSRVQDRTRPSLAAAVVCLLVAALIGTPHFAAGAAPHASPPATAPKRDAATDNAPGGQSGG